MCRSRHHMQSIRTLRSILKWNQRLDSNLQFFISSDALSIRAFSTSISGPVNMFGAICSPLITSLLGKYSFTVINSIASAWIIFYTLVRFETYLTLIAHQWLIMIDLLCLILYQTDELLSYKHASNYVQCIGVYLEIGLAFPGSKSFWSPHHNYQICFSKICDYCMCFFFFWSCKNCNTFPDFLFFSKN